MQTIYRPSEARITVSDARRLILAASPQERWTDIFHIGTKDGQVEDAGFHMVEVVQSTHFVTLTGGLLEVLAELRIAPAMKYFLPRKDFNESSDHDAYVITHDEFVALARYCDVTVLIGEAKVNTTPKQDEALSMPAPPVVYGLGGLPTAEIAHCFSGIQYSEEGWRKPLGGKLKWLEGAVYERGAPPKPNLWRPVDFAAAVHRKFGIAPRKLRARFQTMQALKPWHQAWLDYEDEYIDTSND